jgi:hypothetical protein
MLNYDLFYNIPTINKMLLLQYLWKVKYIKWRIWPLDIKTTKKMYLLVTPYFFCYVKTSLSLKKRAGDLQI